MIKIKLDKKEVEVLIIGLKEVQVNKGRFDEHYKELVEREVPPLLWKLEFLKRR